MDEKHVAKIAEEVQLKPKQVAATATLLEAGDTVPFIARYRKEVTGSLDEVAITTIRERLHQLREVDKRRESILKSLAERELLADELRENILAAETLSVLEDIYLPYRPKRRTRATIARDRGLESLALKLFAQEVTMNPLNEAEGFIDPEKGVGTVDDALAGARDIIAEWVNENQEARAKMRALYAQKAVFNAKVVQGKEAEGSKYRDYFDWEEVAATTPSHRILAMRRGEKEGFLTLRAHPPEDQALTLLETIFVRRDCAAAQQVKAAVHDSYKRLLSSSMETEIRQSTKERADADAIGVFADNIKQLLLAPPLGQKNVLAIDPGIRTGCKVVCLNQQGKLLHSDTIYPFMSEESKKESMATLVKLCESHQVEAIAVGNGTGGRETETWIRNSSAQLNIPVLLVNETGASVYSASAVARAEFPDLDVTIRGAVSIGRRLMDPLAELVKIDPKSIGVGQYQHDVEQLALKRGLDDVVTSCVNAVGVEVNTASEQLLQAAGFMRIIKGKNPLDASAVHPESYLIVEEMAKGLDCSVMNLMRDPELRHRIDISKYVTERVGIPTLTDILTELAKPGRDPRQQFEPFTFAKDVNRIEDLRPGMRLPGIVTNVTAFGAFVDIGVHQDGLVHVSQLADRFVKDPHEVVKVQQHVSVAVLNVDFERNRIALSMRKNPGRSGGETKAKSEQVRKIEKKPKPERKGRAPFNNPFARTLKK
jgi:uncharacterized protein